MLLFDIGNCYLTDLLLNGLKLMPQLTDDIIFSPPVIYESEGVDQNGNIFHDKQITLTGTSNKNIILNNDYSNNDYFYSDQLLPKQAVQDMSLEGLLFFTVQ